MKVKITAEMRRDLETLRLQIQTVLAAMTRSNGTLGRLTTRRSQLAAEIAEIEGADNPGKEAIASLGDKETELRLVDRKIEQLSGTGTHGEELAKLQHEATQLVKRALKPSQDDCEAEIMSGLRPFYRAERFSVVMARATDKAMDFGAFVHRGFGRSIPEANLALKVIDEILNGELSWQFDPPRRVTKPA